MSRTQLKPLPQFTSDAEAERFVEEADLSEYDLSGFGAATMTRRGATSVYSFEMPSDLLHRIDARATEQGVSVDAYLLSLVRKDLDAD